MEEVSKLLTHLKNQPGCGTALPTSEPGAGIREVMPHELTVHELTVLLKAKYGTHPIPTGERPKWVKRALEKFEEEKQRALKGDDILEFGAGYAIDIQRYIAHLESHPHTPDCRMVENGWRPIGDMPVEFKDGRYFLTCSPNHKQHGPWISRFGDDDRQHPYHEVGTLWQPLPEVPIQDKKEG